MSLTANDVVPLEQIEVFLRNDFILSESENIWSKKQKDRFTVLFLICFNTVYGHTQLSKAVLIFSYDIAFKIGIM